MLWKDMSAKNQFSQFGISKLLLPKIAPSMTSQFFVFLAYAFSKLCCTKKTHIKIAADNVNTTE